MGGLLPQLALWRTQVHGDVVAVRYFLLLLYFPPNKAGYSFGVLMNH